MSAVFAPERTSKDSDREFEWSDADFQKVQTLIYQRAGISLQDGKHAMVYSRLSRRLRETGCRSFREYLSRLEASESSEWQEFVNALTTNLTSFFREPHHFPVLSAFLQSQKRTEPWRIWCSAASTGEEPYSIAATAAQALGSTEGFTLAASDIDSKVLATAAKGVYPLESIAGIDKNLLEHYFLRGKGSNYGMVCIKPALRQKIEFLMVNLIQEPWPFKTLFDVVFCRNVMIYFDTATQRKVLERMHRVMKPGALLFVGHSENFSSSRDLFALNGKTVYTRLP
jgi:chemotaxis protein methyltransferase CheR